jgi:hypothetical protein
MLFVIASMTFSFHQRNVLVRGSMENGVGLVDLEYCCDPFPVPHVRDDGHDGDIGKRCLQLVDDVEDRVLPVTEKDEAGRCKSCNLPTELTADRSARSRNKDGLACPQLRDGGQVGLDGVPPQQVLDLHLAKTCSVRLRRNQLGQTRHRERRNAAVQSRSHDFADDVAASRGHCDNQLGDSVLLHDAFDRAESSHDGKLQQHVVLFGQIIVDESDRLEAEVGIRYQLLSHELGGIPGADYQCRSAGIVATPTRCP